jgi:hypothetical protein
VADDPLNLDEPGEWAGLWWLPEEPENQIPGVLRYLPDGKLELSLIGAFEERLMTTTSPGVVLIHGGRGASTSFTELRNDGRSLSSTATRARPTEPWAPG